MLAVPLFFAQKHGVGFIHINGLTCLLQPLLLLIPPHHEHVIDLVSNAPASLHVYLLREDLICLAFAYMVD